MSRQFWPFLSPTNSEWNKIDYNRNVAWQEDILTESNDLSTKDCNGKTKKQITRSVRRLQSYFQITVTIFTLDYVNINFPSQYNRQNNPKSFPSLTRDLRFVLFTLFSDLLLIVPNDSNSMLCNGGSRTLHIEWQAQPASASLLFLWSECPKLNSDVTGY